MMISSSLAAALPLLVLLSPHSSAEAVDVDWTALSSQVSSPVQPTDVQLWLDQCIKPFDAVTVSPLALQLGGVPNYELFEQSSGLCMQTASCAFTYCGGIFNETYFPFTFDLSGAAFYQSAETEMYNTIYGPGTYPIVTDEEIVEAASTSEDSQLPAAVVHPEHPGDVSAAVRFAADNGLKVSVKTSGHNWMGSSTKKDSLLLNLSKLRKYALPETVTEGIFVCDNNENSEEYASVAIADACKLAVARGKPAVMRAGGGQIVDEGLRAVEEWNSDVSRTPLHAMVGSAGTVSLAGGWLASGGLGGSLGMRKYGVGVDQVLHAEMVLPDGRFVRFGPSAWTPAEGDQLHPQTTEVKGFCIADGVDLSDERNWKWVECDGEYNFADLWYAIRGGSGGSWGVVTSIYYQLHSKPGNLQTVQWPEPIGSIMFDPAISDEDKGEMVAQILKFVFTFLYSPEKLGVPAKVSYSCSSPDVGGLQCYDGAGEIFISAWNKHFNGTVPAMPSVRFDERASYASSREAWNDRIPDGPRGNLLFVNVNPMVIPVDIIQNKFGEFMNIYIPCFLSSVISSFSGSSVDDLCTVIQPYFYGGGTQHASDGMDAYPPHRRNGAFHFYTLQDDVRAQLKKLYWDVPEETEVYTGESFPGIYCHNHLYYTISPRKSNWLTDCEETLDGSGTPLNDDDCMSLQEASFGTATLRRLEKIHSDIDPLQMFQTPDGPGYDTDAANDGPNSASSAETPTFFFVLGGPIISSLVSLSAYFF